MTFLSETLDSGFGALSVSTPAPTIDNAVFWAGGGSAKITTATDQRYVFLTEGGSQNGIVGRFYWQRQTVPGGGYQNIFRMGGNGGNHIYLTLKSDTHIAVSPGTGGGQAGEQASASATSISTWYRIDFAFDISANPWQLRWQIDGVAQTTSTPALAASTYVNYIYGNVDDSESLTFNYDEIAMSYVAGDYPLGPVAQAGPPVNNPVWPRVRFNG